MAHQPHASELAAPQQGAALVTGGIVEAATLGLVDRGEVRAGLGRARRGDGIFTGWRVRRLTPLECERLQGFPDGFTAIPYRGKTAADGPRYRALGNSMAVNVMRWIGTRIQMVEELSP